MSRKNVEPLPIQTACEAISRLDGEALVALCDPNVRFESRITAVEDETYDGHQGVRQYMVNLTEAFGPPLQAVSSGLIAASSCCSSPSAGSSPPRWALRSDRFAPTRPGEDRMHAVVVSVTIQDGEAATKYLREEVVPQVSQAPGFVAGYWVRLEGGNSGRGVIIFESEDVARAASQRVSAAPGGATTIDSVDVGEVVANA